MGMELYLYFLLPACSHSYTCFSVLIWEEFCRNHFGSFVCLFLSFYFFYFFLLICTNPCFRTSPQGWSLFANYLYLLLYLNWNFWSWGECPHANKTLSVKSCLFLCPSACPAETLHLAPNVGHLRLSAEKLERERNWELESVELAKLG
jgi:hypothetical protein